MNGILIAFALALTAVKATYIPVYPQYCSNISHNATHYSSFAIHFGSHSQQLGDTIYRLIHSNLTLSDTKIYMPVLAFGGAITVVILIIWIALCCKRCSKAPNLAHC